MNILDSVWILWLLSEIYFSVARRSKKTESKEMDKNSLRIIWLVIIFSVSTGVFITKNFNVPILNSFLLKYIGLVLIVAGVIIRFTAIRTLGKFFTVNLNIDQNHRLVNRGLYKYIRHPAYSGSLLSFLGLTLNFNNWICFFVILIPVSAAFIYRINVEEKLLIEQEELNYSEYMKNTKKLIPFFY